MDKANLVGLTLIILSIIVVVYGLINTIPRTWGFYGILITGTLFIICEIILYLSVQKNKIRELKKSEAENVL